MLGRIARATLVPYWYFATGLLFVLYGSVSIGALVWRNPNADWRGRSASALVLVGTVLVCIYLLAVAYPAWAQRALTVRFLVLVLAGMAVGVLVATVLAVTLVKGIQHVRIGRTR